MLLKKCLAIAVCTAAMAISLAMPAHAALPANATADDIFLALRDAVRADDSASALSLAARSQKYVTF